MSTNKGFGLIELIVAVGLFVIIVVSGISTIINSLTINRLSDNQTKASLYAKEGIEAIRSIRNQGFINLYPGDYGLSSSSGIWALSGTANTLDKYTRVIKLENVQRNPSGQIVASGGTVDPQTIKATATVNWSFSPTRNLSVVLSEYLTNFREAKAPKWEPPNIESFIDLTGSLDGYSVTYEGNYAYLGRDLGVPNFVVIDVTAPSTPVAVGSTFSGGRLKEVVINGNYVYAADSTNNGELRVFNVTNKTSPTLFGTYNAPGNADALGLAVNGNYVYLVRVNSNEAELLIINISNPAAPSLTGSLQLSGTINSVYVEGNYAYLASSDNSSELQIVNISNPAAPSLATSFDLSGNDDAIAIDYHENYVYLGRSNGSLSIVNATNPLSPSLTGQFAGNGGVINHIDHIADLDLVFMATSATGYQLEVVDVSNKSTPTLHGSIAMSDTNYGVVYNPSQDRVYLASADNLAEFIVLSP